jgi:hypothetical protein
MSTRLITMVILGLYFFFYLFFYYLQLKINDWRISFIFPLAVFTGNTFLVFIIKKLVLLERRTTIGYYNLSVTKKLIVA